MGCFLGSMRLTASIADFSSSILSLAARSAASCSHAVVLSAASFSCIAISAWVGSDGDWGCCLEMFAIVIVMRKLGCVKRGCCFDEDEGRRILEVGQRDCIQN